MNFLGHIYFSHNNVELMHANLFGDFVKGKNLDAYNETIRKGIILHRNIDWYIGQHEEVRKLTKLLSPSLPKVSGVAVDLFFDHFLAKNWMNYHPVQLDEFLECFYRYNIKEKEYPSELFLQMIFHLKKGRWISQYAHLSGIEKACMGVSQRISFPNALMNGREILEDNYFVVEDTFHKYMKDAINYFSEENKL